MRVLCALSKKKQQKNKKKLKKIKKTWRELLFDMLIIGLIKKTSGSTALNAPFYDFLFW